MSLDRAKSLIKSATNRITSNASIRRFLPGQKGNGSARNVMPM
jgi:hypothetical protein